MATASAASAPMTAGDVPEHTVTEMAAYYGIKLPEEKYLLWIARQACVEPMPGGYQEFQDDEGNVFYFNSETQESTFDNPLDETFKFLINKERQKYKEGIAAAAAAMPEAGDMPAQAFTRPRRGRGGRGRPEMQDGQDEEEDDDEEEEEEAPEPAPEPEPEPAAVSMRLDPESDDSPSPRSSKGGDSPGSSGRRRTSPGSYQFGGGSRRTSPRGETASPKKTASPSSVRLRCSYARCPEGGQVWGSQGELDAHVESRHCLQCPHRDCPEQWRAMPNKQMLDSHVWHACSVKKGANAFQEYEQEAKRRQQVVAAARSGIQEVSARSLGRAATAPGATVTDTSESSAAKRAHSSSQATAGNDNNGRPMGQGRQAGGASGGGSHSPAKKRAGGSSSAGKQRTPRQREAEKKEKLKREREEREKKAEIDRKKAAAATGQTIYPSDSEAGDTEMHAIGGLFGDAPEDDY